MYADVNTFSTALNKGLKKVGKLVGVDDLEFYAARHSWACLLYTSLQQVCLFRLGGQTGGRAAALHVEHYQRKFGNDC